MSVATEITRLQSAKTAIKTAIENKGVTVGDGLIDTYAEKIDEIPMGGSDNYYDTFWDILQNYGEASDYRFTFSYRRWTDEIYNPKYPIKQNGYAYTRSMFENNANITDTKVPIEILNSTPTNTSVFTGMTTLVRIPKLIVGGNASFNMWFNNCQALTDITIEGSIDVTISFAWSPLNKPSIINVFDVLLSTATGQTVTFKKTAVDAAFETSEGANDGGTSDEWNTLVASKPNWTVSLS